MIPVSTTTMQQRRLCLPFWIYSSSMIKCHKKCHLSGFSGWILVSSQIHWCFSMALQVHSSSNPAAAYLLYTFYFLNFHLVWKNQRDFARAFLLKASPVLRSRVRAYKYTIKYKFCLNTVDTFDWKKFNFEHKSCCFRFTLFRSLLKCFILFYLSTFRSKPVRYTYLTDLILTLRPIGIGPIFIMLFYTFCYKNLIYKFFSSMM